MSRRNAQQHLSSSEKTEHLIYRARLALQGSANAMADFQRRYEQLARQLDDFQLWLPNWDNPRTKSDGHGGTFSWPFWDH